MKEYLARRMVGISLKKMNYNDDFYRFCKKLFEYQYTIKRIEVNSEVVYWLYNHSNGLPSMVVSLFVEAQRRAVLDDKDSIDVGTLNEVYKLYYSTMTTYIENPFVKYKNEKEDTNVKLPSCVKNEVENLFKIVSKIAFKDVDKALHLLKDQVVVEFI